MGLVEKAILGVLALIAVAAIAVPILLLIDLRRRGGDSPR